MATANVSQGFLTAKGTAIIVPTVDAYTHFPLSPDDLRSVVRMMPLEVFDNLRAVLFLADPTSEEQPQPHEDYSETIGIEILPGVFINKRYQGTYQAPYGMIRLYAYHYDAEALQNRAMWELFLRFRMLTVFLHEVAHHVDRMQQHAPGDELLPPGEHRESESEIISHPWVLHYGIPYLEQTYAEQILELADWAEQYVGRRLSLTDLVVPPRSFVDEARVFTPNDTIFSLELLVTRLAQLVHEGQTIRETRYSSALTFVCRDEYQEASAILLALLADYPQFNEARELYEECREKMACGHESVE